MSTGEASSASRTAVETERRSSSCSNMASQALSRTAPSTSRMASPPSGNETLGTELFKKLLRPETLEASRRMLWICWPRPRLVVKQSRTRNDYIDYGVLDYISLKLELKNMVMCVRVSCEYCDIVSRLINDPKLNFPPRRSNGEVLSLSPLPKFRETAKFAQSREQRRRERTSLAKLKMTSESRSAPPRPHPRLMLPTALEAANRSGFRSCQRLHPMRRAKIRSLVAWQSVGRILNFAPIALNVARQSKYSRLFPGIPGDALRACSVVLEKSEGADTGSGYFNVQLIIPRLQQEEGNLKHPAPNEVRTLQIFSHNIREIHSKLT